MLYFVALVEGSWRKFRSQTSDDIWTDGKAEVGRVREEKSRREKMREEKDAGARKGNKVAKHYVFQWFVASEGRKVGALKRRVRSHMVRWEMKSCTPWWREAPLQVKKLRTPHVRSTFGSWDVEKCTPLWHEARVKVKTYKARHARSTFVSWDDEKVHAVVARSTFSSQMHKTHAMLGALL